jgi:hypothetical protein
MFSFALAVYNLVRIPPDTGIAIEPIQGAGS